MTDDHDSMRDRWIFVTFIMAIVTFNNVENALSQMFSGLVAGGFGFWYILRGDAER